MADSLPATPTEGKKVIQVPVFQSFILEMWLKVKVFFM